MRRYSVLTVILSCVVVQLSVAALAAGTLPTPARPLPKYIHFTEIHQALNARGEVVRIFPDGECWYALPFNWRIEDPARIEVRKETPDQGVMLSWLDKENMESNQQPVANPQRIPADYALPDYIIRDAKGVKGLTVVNGTGKYEGAAYPTVTVTRPATKDNKGRAHGREKDIMYLDPKTGWIAVRIHERYDATDKWVLDR